MDAPRAQYALRRAALLRSFSSRFLSRPLKSWWCRFYFFFFQAEDGIRDLIVTGVQTCALPISAHAAERAHRRIRAVEKIPGGVNSPVRAFRSVGGQPVFIARGEGSHLFDVDEIGRASCRERV